jgi:hypothetical protein
MTAVERDFTEKALAYAEFIRNNKLYAFREPTEQERAVEAAVDEQLFFPPNPKQAELLAGWLIPEKKVFTFTGGNRLGKTTVLVIIALSVMFGRWLWNDVPIVFPKKKYRTRKVRIIGQSWESQIKAVLVPKLKEWWPKNRPLETKKNNQGVEYWWKDVATGSTLEIMSNSQASDVMEGEDCDLIGYDEPPERDNRIACARGLIDRGGRELFSATLIKQAWIHREVIKARLPDGSPDPTVFNVMGAMRDNLGFGLSEGDIQQFASKLKPDEIAARIDGKPSYMTSLVFPRFNRDVHVREPFKIPLDWIVDVSIDFHPSKPWAVVFMATGRNNFKYVFKELHDRGNPKYIAEEIIRVVNSGNLRVGRCIIDPLAKGDQNNDNTVYEIMSQVLGSHNISLDVASKDKDNGIALVNNLLMTENEMPGLFLFKDCPNTIRQVEDLMYDPDSLKPTAMKVEDDFTECLYRLALLDTQWFSNTDYNSNLQKSMML